MSFQSSRCVFGDGQGRIWLSNGDGSNLVLFPHWGWDPSFCNDGASVIFVDFSRHWVWVAYRDGSGLYGLGVTADYMARPQLAANNSRYVTNSRNPSTGMWDVYSCGWWGSNLTWLLSSVASPGCISQDGTRVYAGGWTGSTYRICWVNADGSGFGWVPYTPPNADFPHVAMPTIYNGELAVMIGDFTGLNMVMPSTYRTSDIAVLSVNDGSVIRLNASPPGPGYLVTNPSWQMSKLSDGLIYDVVEPGGCGIRAAYIPGRGPGGYSIVYASPLGGSWQFGDMGCNRNTLTP